ncbi:Sensory neuron membrane protein 1 [Eumeta japonica]|uniref:Scavenger receptor class B member 1 n=1 Tax=Eumeta variegata TaxID=151549 RepID=A0A4C1YFX0_EUMVA|nr:Sensory neuron membrane protein 1 [Eumeta japonica]
MGIAMRARARIQINLAVSQVVDIKQVANFPDIVFPIMWFEEGINELPDEVTSLLRLATKVPPVARAALGWGLSALGLLLVLLAVTCLISTVDSLNDIRNSRDVSLPRKIRALRSAAPPRPYPRPCPAPRSRSRSRSCSDIVSILIPFFLFLFRFAATSSHRQSTLKLEGHAIAKHLAQKQPSKDNDYELNRR